MEVLGNDAEQMFCLAETLWYKTEAELVQNYKAGCEVPEKTKEDCEKRKGKIRGFSEVLRKIIQDPDSGVLVEIESEDGLLVIAQYDDYEDYCSDVAELWIKNNSNYQICFDHFDAIMPAYIKKKLPPKKYDADP